MTLNLADLNERQLEGVMATEGPVLIISGPGSGKTKCLTYRIAYMISKGKSPGHILGITFTNKSAAEMRGRVSNLLGSKNIDTPLIGTFHSIGLKILRREIHNLNYRSNFTIFDSDDQVSLVKRIMAELELDSKKTNPKAVLSHISKLKTEFVEPEYAPSEYFFEKIVSSIYKRYQEKLRRLNAVDFDDLIVLCVKIFEANPKILAKYQDLWKYILVDEYQDTSRDQYQFISLLAKTNKNLFCIGDDAQSIYEFRRADIRNILNFQKDYPEAKIVMLEQNYRSTKNIITAASHLITNNKNQMPKELWTDNKEGEKILVKELLNERSEASFIVSKIAGFVTKGYSLNDCAVLYRTHAQSRAVEEALISSGVPYQIIGGIKFYERKEIKDILAYLKLIHNPSDAVSFERIYNIPARGIGKATFQKIISSGEDNLIKAVQKVSTGSAKSGSLKRLYELLNKIGKEVKEKKLTYIIQYIVKETGYEEYLKSISFSKTGSYDNFDERMENIKELLTVAKKYDQHKPREGREKFLEGIALIQDADKIGEGPIKTTLMTIHSSKGLEFPVLFIVGMEEGLFPHSRTMFNPQEMEEERRLCYVAVTRAKEHLTITYAKYRNVFGVSEANLPSRFISELPQHLLNHDEWDTGDNDEERIFY